MKTTTDESELTALRHEIAELRAEIRRYAVPDGRQVDQLFSEFRGQCAEAAVRGHIENASDLIGREASGVLWRKSVRLLLPPSLRARSSA